MQGYDRLRVMSRAPVNAKVSGHFFVSDVVHCGFLFVLFYSFIFSIFFSSFSYSFCSFCSFLFSPFYLPFLSFLPHGNTQSDHFQRVDEKRQLDYEAKLAVKRARDRHAATSKKFRSLNRIGGGGFDKILDCVNAFVSL